MNGEPLVVDAWARARQTDIHIFVQETHHARRLNPEGYSARDAETWDKLFAVWLISKGRVRAPGTQFLWAEPEYVDAHETPDGGVVINISSRLLEEDLPGEIAADEGDFAPLVIPTTYNPDAPPAPGRLIKKAKADIAVRRMRAETGLFA